MNKQINVNSYQTGKPINPKLNIRDNNNTDDLYKQPLGAAS